jgi:hypothetical protein
LILFDLYSFEKLARCIVLIKSTLTAKVIPAQMGIEAARLAQIPISNGLTALLLCFGNGFAGRPSTGKAAANRQPKSEPDI